MTNEINIYDAKELNADTVKKFLKGGGSASNEELAMLLAISRNLNLNPFTKEVYFIKYGSAPAQIIVSRDAYRKRAQANPNYAGTESGVIVQKEDGTVENLDGAFKTKKDELIGAWCRVYLKNTEIPIYVAVSYDEYVQKKDGHPNAMWTAKPMTMLVKVAESQALRMAFPSELSGTYAEEEFDIKDVTPKVDEKTGVEIPTTEEINNFDKEQYLKDKKAELSKKASPKIVKADENGEIIETPEPEQVELNVEDF